MSLTVVRAKVIARQFEEVTQGTPAEHAVRLVAVDHLGKMHAPRSSLDEGNLGRVSGAHPASSMMQAGLIEVLGIP